MCENDPAFAAKLASFSSPPKMLLYLSRRGSLTWKGALLAETEHFDANIE